MSDSMSDGRHSPKRTWLAVLLTVVVPGLGHVYLKLWLRALLWLFFYVAATTVVLPDRATPDGLSVDAFVSAGEAVPLEAGVVIVGISVVCLLDVFVMTRQINKAGQASAEMGGSCPNCGRELDEDLSFCHWCTTELDRAEE